MDQVALIQLRKVRTELRFIAAIAHYVGHQSRRMRLAKRRTSVKINL